jgi:hypothetical protein
VKRGGDLFLDYARLLNANVTICSASSYCFWPALATNGQAYFPLSAVIGRIMYCRHLHNLWLTCLRMVAAGADSIELAPKFGDHFHWIEKPAIISDFRKFRPWNAAIHVLKGLKPMPS